MRKGDGTWRGDMGELLHIVLHFDTKCLRPVIPKWPDGERPTKVGALSEADELNTGPLIALGLGVSGDDTFLHETGYTLNLRIFECQTTRRTGRLFSPVFSLQQRGACGPERMSVHSKVPQHLVVNQSRQLPLCGSAMKAAILVPVGTSTERSALVSETAASPEQAGPLAPGSLGGWAAGL